MLLAIDTSTRVMSIALHDVHSLIGEQSWQAGNQHNTLLAPSIERMLNICNVSMDVLTGLGVSVGPGSYTGLRIGVAFAKGLAAVHNLPLVGITTLDTLAAAQPFYNTPYALITVVQAGRGRIIIGRYRGKKGRWTPDDDPYLTTWEELLDGIEERTYLTGEIDAAGHGTIEQAQQNQIPVTLVNAAYRLRRAGFLAAEALQRLHDGNMKDFHPANVTPVYLKRPG